MYHHRLSSQLSLQSLNSSYWKILPCLFALFPNSSVWATLQSKRSNSVTCLLKSLCWLQFCLLQNTLVPTYFSSLASHCILPSLFAHKPHCSASHQHQMCISISWVLSTLIGVGGLQRKEFHTTHIPDVPWVGLAIHLRASVHVVSFHKMLVLLFFAWLIPHLPSDLKEFTFPQGSLSWFVFSVIFSHTTIILSF